MSSPNSKSKPLLIADAGPLLALARIKQVHLLSALFSKVEVTQTVWKETQAKPELHDARTLCMATEQGLLTIIPDPPHSKLFNSLDAGERSTLQAALAGQATVFLDEVKGRAQAKAHSIPVIGCLGVLLLAKEKGMLDMVMPCVEALELTGYRFSSRLIERTRKLANE